MEMRNQPLLGLIAVAVLSVMIISVTATQKSYAQSIVTAYNIQEQDPPTKTVKLTQQVLVDVLEGKITKWNDPQIQALNPGTNLPAAKVYFEPWSKSGDFSIFW
jgi:ABC-type phosphate transport system substrate-binding protein